VLSFSVITDDLTLSSKDQNVFANINFFQNKKQIFNFLSFFFMQSWYEDLLGDGLK
jgi:hypothetical protein